MADTNAIGPRDGTAWFFDRPLSAPEPMPKWNRFYGDQGLTDAEHARLHAFDALSQAAVVSWSDGVSFQVSPADQVSRAVFVSGTYEPNTLAVLRALLQPADTFVDVGANAGIITLAAAQWVGPQGRIYAFEPSRREFRRLSDTIARNRLAQAVAVPAGVGAGAGTLLLRVADDIHCGLNTLGNGFPYAGIEVARMEPVDIVALDDYAAGHHLPRIAVMKIDVEGFEVAVIEGAARVLERDRPALVIEVFARALETVGTSVPRLELALAAHDYLFFAIEDDGSLEEIASLVERDGDNVVVVPRERLSLTAAMRVVRL